MPIDYATITDQFEKHWKNKEYEEGLTVYYDAGRPFWLAGDVGYYYERTGHLEKAAAEYQYLVDQYFEIRPDFLPLPNGPPELYKVGKFYAKRNKAKARKYLELYLSAETKCGRDPAFHLPYKAKARKLLNKLTG